MYITYSISTFFPWVLLWKFLQPSSSSILKTHLLLLKAKQKNNHTWLFFCSAFKGFPNVWEFMTSNAVIYLVSFLVIKIPIVCLYTIHKNDVCLRQKSPKPMYMTSSSVFNAGHKNPINFEIEATFQTLFQFFWLILINFSVFSQIVANFVENDGITQPRKCNVFVFILSWTAWVNRPLRSKIHSKWKMASIWRPLNIFKK